MLMTSGKDGLKTHYYANEAMLHWINWNYL